MNWKKLKDYKCPKCSAYLKEELETTSYICASCEFRISHVKFTEIVNKIIFKPKFQTEEDNLFQLNNL